MKMKCVKCGKLLSYFEFNKMTYICNSCQKHRPCFICGRLRSPYGLKIVGDKEICRKGLCRRLYYEYKDLDECKSMYNW